MDAYGLSPLSACKLTNKPAHQRRLPLPSHYSILLHRKPFLPDHLHHLIHILRTKLITLCLNHHTDHRLCTALTQKDSSILAQTNADPLLFRLHTRIAGNRRLVLNPHILQKLRVHLHPLAQRAEALLLLQNHLHQHQCRKDSISGRRMLTKNDMSGLLSAEHISGRNTRKRICSTSLPVTRKVRSL